MKKGKLKKSTIIILLICVGLVGIVYVAISTGGVSLATFGSDLETMKQARVVDELEDGCFYIWHNEKESDIKVDLEKGSEDYIFQMCPSGEKNWEDNSSVNHTLWFTSSNDAEIPTLYPGDELIYVSTTYVPYEGINWEHFADYGYTIGIANMEGDNSGHYRITNNGEGDYSGYIYPNSDAAELEKYANVESLFLDKIGSIKVRENLVSDGGTITGLEKDKSYVCEWYTGTYYQDYELKANIHAFGSLETFVTYDYEFLHSRCISITIPDWLTTGYYYLDEIGFFRYVSEEDAKNYNGKPYDPDIDWNEPIIILNENGLIEYDPTTEGDSYSTEKTTTEETARPECSEKETTQDVVDETERMEIDYSDAGAEEYEDITNEIIIP